jgi:lysozyme family protein
METNFEKAFEFAMKWEKYRSDDPRDPGGLTIWGISSRYHPDKVKIMEGLDRDQARDFAKKIYHDEYWLKLGCDKIGAPLDIVVFDTAIVPGPKVATVLLDVTHDWKDYIFLRLAHFAGSPVVNIYLKGWVNRNMDLWKMLKGL